jgi:hypothetical protein
VIYRVFLNDEDFVVIDADSPEEAILKLSFRAPVGAPKHATGRQWHLPRRGPRGRGRGGDLGPMRRPDLTAGQHSAAF